MSKLNLARVALKHHGQPPSASTVDEARGSVSSFLKDGCSDVFGLDFDSISMVDLVAFVPVRERLVRAEQAIAVSEFKPAMEELALAFAQLLAQYDVVGDIAAFRPHWVPRLASSKFGFTASLADAGEWAANTVADLAEAVRVLALDLDYRRYRRFRRLTPPVRRGFPNGFELAPQYGAPPKPPTREQCEECVAFVIDSALRVQE